MLDRTIPFYTTILMCDRYDRKKITLPDGFEITAYRDGYEKAWARLECGIGDFDSPEEAKNYFISTYLKEESRFGDILFMLNAEQHVVGSCIAWDDRHGDTEAASLHWLVVDEACQGLGLGRALCTAVMDRFSEQGKCPVYIHTQPWSWKAILLYISMGFRLQKSDTVSGYENQFAQSVQTLRGVVSKEQFVVITAAVES